MRNLFWRLWGGSCQKHRGTNQKRKERKIKSSHCNKLFTRYKPIIIYNNVQCKCVCALLCVLIYLYINGIYYIGVCRAVVSNVK